MSQDKDKCLTEVSEQLSEFFDEFVIIGIPKGKSDRVSVAFFGSAPEALELLQKAESSIKDTL